MFDNLQEIIDKKNNDNKFNGVVLIKQGNNVLFAGNTGYANRPFKVSNEINTRFRIASISKMFTAVSILQLVEKNKIDLETSVVKYLELKDTFISEEVTIHHLLTHTSGIGDYYDESLGDEEWLKLWSEKPIYNVRTLNDYLNLFRNKKPVNEPGKKYKYNGAGYILLGLVIEKASGVSYFDYVRKNIFDKLNMNETDFLSLDGVHDNVAEGYEYADNEWTRNIYTATPTAASDGGAISTANDLIVFIQALKNYKLLNEELTNKILSPHVVDKNSNGFRDYCWMYGYANQMILKNDKVIRGGHTGEEYGVSARIYYYPKLNIDVVILANQGFCAGKLGWEIHDMILENETRHK